jgi:hypothetical protein
MRQGWPAAPRRGVGGGVIVHEHVSIAMYLIQCLFSNLRDQVGTRIGDGNT